MQRQAFIILLVLCSVFLMAQAISQQELWSSYHASLRQFIRAHNAHYNDNNSLLQIAAEPLEAYWNENKYYVCLMSHCNSLLTSLQK